MLAKRDTFEDKIALKRPMDYMRFAKYIGLIVFGLLLGFFLFNDGIDHQEEISSSHEHGLEGRWTCAMHPEVDGQEHEKCPLCAMDLVFQPEGGLGIDETVFELSQEALALANIQTTIISRTAPEHAVITLSGTLVTNPETDAVQTTLYEGRIDALYPNSIGKKVYKGGEIGKIYSPELYSAQDKLLTSANYRESHQKLYEAARYTLGLWKVTDEQIEAMLKNGKPFMNFPIISDVTGTVTEIMVSEGNYYQEGTPMFKVSNLNTLWAEFDAYEEQLPLLKVGQQVSLTMNGFHGKSIQGKISYIEPVLDNLRRTTKVRVVVGNKEGLLKPGMFAKANVKTTMEPVLDNHVIVPKSAVLWTGTRSIVYKRPNHDRTQFELVEVELGQALENHYVITSGLTYGDEIVVNGAFTIDAAAQLSGKQSMMNRHDAKDVDLENPVGPVKDVNTIQSIIVADNQSIESFLTTYFLMKDALVQSDFESAKEQLGILGSKLISMGKSDKNGNFMAALNNKMMAMEKTNTIDELRLRFKPFSAQVIEWVKSSKIGSETVYVQFCPMADNNSGAYWLSLQEEIRNPYFGDKMLICGVVKEKIN